MPSPGSAAASSCRECITKIGDVVWQQNDIHVDILYSCNYGTSGACAAFQQFGYLKLDTIYLPFSLG